jgi:DNA polymerase
MTGVASIAELRVLAAACRACDLWKCGTQTVFGEGPESAAVMLVGEQPGDREDIEGHPFVGPAGRLLDRALEEAPIDRSLVYVTNAVKHFKWRPRGKRRLHQRPDREEIQACRPWLVAEAAAIQPQYLVCLGATAVSAVLGSSVRVMRDHGQFFESDLGPLVTVTIHPSAVLRAPDEEGRRAQYELLLHDLRRVAERLGPGQP